MKPLKLGNTAVEFHDRLAVALLEPEGKKVGLVRLRVKNDDITGVLQNSHTGTAPDVLPLDSSQILSLVLNSTKAGSVYGVKIEPWFRVEKIPNWGLTNYFTTLADSEHIILRNGLRRNFVRLIDKYSLHYLLPLNIEIRPNRGKVVGMYRTVTKEDTADTLILCPPSFVDAGIDGICAIVAHEMGHPIWGKYLPDNYKVRWLKAYLAATKIEEIDIADLKSARVDLINSGMKPSHYRKDLEEKHQAIFDACLDWIASYHHVANGKDKLLDLLVMSGDDLSNLWPKSKLHLSEIQDIISDYAKTNAVEFFCEALGHFISRKSLPSHIVKLIKRSLAIIKAE